MKRFFPASLLFDNGSWTVFENLDAKIATLQRFTADQGNGLIVLIHPVHDLLAVAWIGSERPDTELGRVIIDQHDVFGRAGFKVVKHSPLSKDDHFGYHEIYVRHCCRSPR